MRSVVLEAPETIQVAEGPEPTVSQGEARVRLRSGGVCGSDLAAYRGISPHVTYPRVLGHELLVDVLECADRPDIVGTRAVVEPLLRCGKCRACRRGRYNCCVHLRTLGVHTDGGLRDEATVPAYNVYPVPDAMCDGLAVLAEPTSVAYHAVERSGILAGQVGVVFGAGTIGLLTAQILTRARGCRAIVVDLDEQRLATAQKLGAIPVYSGRDKPADAVSSATGGEMADVVFEATGSEDCTRMTTELVAHAGTIVLVGWNKGAVEVDTVALISKEADLLGSRNSANAFPAVLRMLEDGVVDADAMITHEFSLDAAAAAIELLDRAGAYALKVLIHRT